MSTAALDTFTVEVFNRLKQRADDDEHPLVMFHHVCEGVIADWRRDCPQVLRQYRREIARWRSAKIAHYASTRTLLS
jgi:hypothetical protein